MPPSTTEIRPANESQWKIFLDFLWNGGYRSTIVFSVTLGAIGITVFSDTICKPMPTSSGQSTSQPLQLQPNPICAKYFELAFMVVGGYLGLSTANSKRTEPDKDTTPTEGGGSSGNDKPNNNNQITRQPQQQESSSTPATAVLTDESHSEAFNQGGRARGPVDPPEDQQPQQASQDISGASPSGGSP